VRALVYEKHLPRLALTKLLSAFTPRAFVGPLAPIQLREIPEPIPLAPDWLVIRTNLCGLCGSDYKQVFMNGATDNPMTSMISFPQVLGHEVVGVVESVGPEVELRRVGERVVLNPWLSCAPRGLPLCEWCLRGEFAQCLNFTRGNIAPGIHHGNSAHATGGFAPRLPAHESQCIPVPDDVSDEAAVLADPFAVSLHAILHHPPSEGVLAHEPSGAVIAGVAEALGVEQHVPWRGLPMLNGGVDVVYDTVSSPRTLEIGVRVTRSRGKIVALGVEVPRRFEWTPLYFKELALVGSNAFATEEWQGRRRHAMEWYFEFIREGRIDVTAILTHRFSLEQYPEAFSTCWDQGKSRAVKVLFEFSGDGAANRAPLV